MPRDPSLADHLHCPNAKIPLFSHLTCQHWKWMRRSSFCRPTHKFPSWVSSWRVGWAESKGKGSSSRDFWPFDPQYSYLAVVCRKMMAKDWAQAHWFWLLGEVLPTILPNSPEDLSLDPEEGAGFNKPDRHQDDQSRANDQRSIERKETWHPYNQEAEQPQSLQRQRPLLFLEGVAKQWLWCISHCVGPVGRVELSCSKCTWCKWLNQAYSPSAVPFDWGL